MLLAIGAWACVVSPAERAAQRGDLTALRDVIAARERMGTLTNSEAARLAKTIAVREVAAAAGAEAVDRVRDARPCAHELDDALATRTRTHDAAGAQAALARLDAGTLRSEDARAFAGDRDAPWRAVSARGLVRAEDREARVRALLDPEPQVRRSAARAAREARDPADLEALVEAARVDPEPIVRTEAVRAVAALPSTSAPAIVDALKDLWRSGDDGLREDIVQAWCGAGLWASGGRDEINVLVASEHGPAVIEAAAAVLRRRGADAEVTQAAVAHIEREIAAGPIATRLQALAQAPMDRKELIAAVQHVAAQGNDLRVRVGALARLAEAKDSIATEELESLARPGSSAREPARFALATAGDRRVQAWIEADLGAERPELRLAAATELAALGLAGRGAPLLSDADPRVRVRAACTIILAVRGAR